MDSHEAKQLDFAITNAVSALAEILGMHWENERRKMQDNSIAYSDDNFNYVVNSRRLFDDAVIERWVK